MVKQPLAVPAQRVRKQVSCSPIPYRDDPSHSTTAKCRDRYAPFVYDTWKSPEVLRIISSIAGIELVPAIDLEIAHINLSAQSQEEMEGELRAVKEKGEQELSAVAWHTDSYPFVCVTMLSDCTDMIGGETALRTGTGDIIKVRGPQMVCCFLNWLIQ